MKKTLLLLALLASGVTLYSCNSTEETTEETATTTTVDGVFTVNTDSSKVMWKGEMLGLYSHEGLAGLKSGTLTIANGTVTGGAFEVDLNNLTPTDEGYNEENTKEKLVGHLSSPDFFNVTEFPTAKFEVTSTEGNKVMGNLTVRGITNAETVENVVVSTTEGGAMVTGDLTFNRTKYDVNFKMDVKDKILSDDITIKVSLMATK